MPRHHSHARPVMRRRPPAVHRLPLLPLLHDLRLPRLLAAGLPVPPPDLAALAGRRRSGATVNTARVHIAVETDAGDITVTKTVRLGQDTTHTDARQLLVDAVAEVRRALGIPPYPGPGGQVQP